jgi:DNA-directed RNA polymerase I, II, and III subunit RPABC2
MSSYFGGSDDENEVESIVDSDSDGVSVEDDGDETELNDGESVASVDEENQDIANITNQLLNPNDEQNGVVVEEEEEDEEEDENYLQKFNEQINKNYILDFHPECAIHNQDEIARLSVVTRDPYTNIIIDPLHRTLPFLTKFERARILGQRTKQINSGAATFVKVPDDMIDGNLIAEMELAQKTIPFIIRRPLCNGGSEYWKVEDLENINF